MAFTSQHSSGGKLTDFGAWELCCASIRNVCNVSQHTCMLHMSTQGASAFPETLQRYTIRDLNTGQLYVLDGDDGAMSPDDPTSPASGRVTDIIQGRQLSLDEFEQVLGLNAVLEVPFSA